MRGAFAHERFSRGEEIAHAITHGLGALGSAAGLVVLVVRAVQHGDVRLLIGVTAFGAAMLTLYAASTLYHALTAARAKRVFKLLDHGAIYLLIAGTYTPFCLITLSGGWGWTLFGLAWGLAILGIVYEVVLGRPWRRLSLVFYLALGWLIVIAVKPLMAALPSQALQWLLFGGLAYTGGAVFYAWRGFPYHHAIWHLWVLAGTGLHYAAVLKYVIPAG
ncbi:MAG: hemolysin III family protein [Candidatus Krumholzibacteria bacterium]|jgi:hemolysin III|nr:hemolysin III family protein [Candidatus Krumholzibacteria bacterium]